MVSNMSNLDTLIVTFQTQLSDVMETVVKTAMYEVTRLVEDGFLEEVKRRNLEVETLRMKLQWAERKLSDRGMKGGKLWKCVDLAKDGVDLPDNSAEKKTQNDVSRGCGTKEEGQCVERWRSKRQEMKSELTPEGEKTAAVLSPDGNSQTMETVDAIPAVDVKEEEVNKVSCSSLRVGRWSVTPNGEGGTDSSEMMDSHHEQSEETRKMDGLMRGVIKHNSQMSTPYVFSDDQENLAMAAVPLVELDISWGGLNLSTAGLLHNQSLASDRETDLSKSRGSIQRTEHELSDSVSTDVQGHIRSERDQTSSLQSSKPKLQISDLSNVSVKQEVIADSDGCEDGQRIQKTAITKAELASHSCLFKHNRMNSETLKQNSIFNKASLHGGLKLHSKVGTALHAALQHLHQPMKKTPHTLSNSTAAPGAVVHSQVSHLNKIPSTSKATQPSALSVQQVHFNDKQAAGLGRSSASWANNRSHHTSANSHHAHLLPLPDSDPIHRQPLRCGQCGKCFPHPSNLKAHQQTHTGERPFCCSLCGRNFTKLSNLKAHRRVHTGERPYCCLACGKRFTQKCNLKRHQRIHLDG